MHRHRRVMDIYQYQSPCRGGSFQQPPSSPRRVLAGWICAIAWMAAPADGCAGTTAELARDDMNAALWMQTAAEYEALALQVYAAAMRAVEVGLADPTIDALPKGERHGDPAALAPAVIVDIDETVLNSPFQARLIHERAGYSASAWYA
ncbi:hypothetical protein [Nannocystis sp. SCPEA4]|uniref:hypothetical protein n=1 Tax=Nannocystis sp. SCPEA4 TaxID=2996787 RepID=UPI00226FDB01|nr:hypothetical protein [Nannocystis sp. SCPEA4]MCY1061755.1 hypothetical protein [Nannocystis sp. SCPEA4]